MTKTKATIYWIATLSVAFIMSISGRTRTHSRAQHDEKHWPTSAILRIFQISWAWQSWPAYASSSLPEFRDLRSGPTQDQPFKKASPLLMT
jgi:hypothetical protein